MKRIIVFIAVLAIGADCLEAKNKFRSSPSGISGDYIVVFEESVPANAVHGLALSLASTYDLEIRFVWNNAIKGFNAIGLSASAERLSADPRVHFVEQALPLTVPTLSLSGVQDTWYNAEYLWHTDRIDEYTYAARDGDYDLCPEARSVVSYVIDSGVRGTHDEFEPSLPINQGGARVRVQKNFTTSPVSDDTSSWCAGSGHPHGTSVAATLAGTHVGVSKPIVVSLRVLGCTGQGSTSSVVSAIDWIRSANDTHAGYPAVVNYSGFVAPWFVSPESVKIAVEGLLLKKINDQFVNNDIVFVTSADNYSSDSCMMEPNSLAYTPNNSNGLILVAGGTSISSSSTSPDYRYQEWGAGGNGTDVDSATGARIGHNSGSNAGACVSVYAPAVSIYTAVGGASGYHRPSGTSYSAPIVAGVAARFIENYVSQYGVRPSRQHVMDSIISQGVAPSATYMTTPDYWMCRSNKGFLRDRFSGTYISSCSVFDSEKEPDEYWLNSVPIHFPSVNNSSGAKMLYWSKSCP